MHKQLNVSLVIRTFSRHSSSTEIPEKILSHQRVFLPGLTQCLFTIRPDFLFGISLNVDLSIISLVCLVRFLVANSCMNNTQVFVKTEPQILNKNCKKKTKIFRCAIFKKSAKLPESGNERSLGTKAERKSAGVYVHTTPSRVPFSFRTV